LDVRYLSRNDEKAFRYNRPLYLSCAQRVNGVAYPTGRFKTMIAMLLAELHDGAGRLVRVADEEG
jgi:hypothetical protein